MAYKPTPGPWTYEKVFNHTANADAFLIRQNLIPTNQSKVVALVTTAGIKIEEAEDNARLLADALTNYSDACDFADKINATHHYLMGVEQDKTVEEIIGDLFELLGYQRDGLRDVQPNNSLFDADF